MNREPDSVMMVITRTTLTLIAGMCIVLFFVLLVEMSADYFNHSNDIGIITGKYYFPAHDKVLEIHVPGSDGGRIWEIRYWHTAESWWISGTKGDVCVPQDVWKAVDKE